MVILTDNTEFLKYLPATNDDAQDFKPNIWSEIYALLRAPPPQNIKILASTG